MWGVEPSTLLPSAVAPMVAAPAPSTDLFFPKDTTWSTTVSDNDVSELMALLLSPAQVPVAVFVDLPSLLDSDDKLALIVGMLAMAPMVTVTRIAGNATPAECTAEEYIDDGTGIANVAAMHVCAHAFAAAEGGLASGDPVRVVVLSANSAVVPAAICVLRASYGATAWQATTAKAAMHAVVRAFAS